MQTPPRTELPLTASASGCGCCSTEATRNLRENDAGVEYNLEGLTCGGCVASVQRALSALDGVDAATIDLVPGGVSCLTVTGSAAISAVRDAVTSAGYCLTAS
jgi:copper chaperone CopZ